MSSGLARKSRPATPADAAVQSSSQTAASGVRDELWRSAPVRAMTPVEARPLTYEERRDRWRRQAGTFRWGTSDTPDQDGAPDGVDTWRGLHQ